MVTLRPMGVDDLALVERWLGEPHVARWYLAGSSLEAELEDIGGNVAEGSGTHMLVVLHDGEPVGWCQWYLCSVDAAWAADMDAGPDDVGVDYAIGEP
ncbi:MAG TPA: GNAT family N-acetyltransferase, partial [Acidimicrobiales bacterium]|nr:GNAT family N-acetyltransferase [Acidimicrobiales bacterium]